MGWSALGTANSTASYSYQYAQTIGENVFALQTSTTQMMGTMNGNQLFQVSPPRVRVVTTSQGDVIGIIGIDSVPQKVTLALNNGPSFTQVTKPNQEWSVNAGKLSLLKEIP